MSIGGNLTNSIQNNFNNLSNIVKDFNQNPTNQPSKISETKSPRRAKHIDTMGLVEKMIVIKNHTAADIAALKVADNMKGSILSLLA